MGHHYHIETDGELFLVRADGRLRFATRLDEVPFAITERFSYEVLPGETVTVCRPHLDKHPTDWVYKDRVPELDDVDVVVQKAINTSLPRCVVGIGLFRDGVDGREVLMVKASRGMTRGMWNIPGGYVEFNEHPAEALAREGMEELGVHCQAGRLVGVYSEFFEHPGDSHHLYGFMYEARADSHDIKPDPDEIADAQWFPVARAIELTRNPFAIQMFRTMLDGTPTAKEARSG